MSPARNKDHGEGGGQKISIVIRGNETHVTVSGARERWRRHAGNANDRPSNQPSIWVRLQPLGRVAVGVATIAAAVVAIWALVVH